MKRHTIALVIFVLLLIVNPAAPALSAKPNPTGPIDMEGTLNGAAYKIRVPEEWNGTLVIHARGYSPTPVTDPDAAMLGEEAETLLLAEGYALAASGFRNAGWNVEEGIHDTRRLVLHFREHVAKPSRVIISGGSMGTVVALESMEKYHGFYDGAIPMCSVAMGATRNADLKLDFTVSYATAFGWQPGWGDVGDLPDGPEEFEIYQQVKADVFRHMQDMGDMDTFARFEFMRLVNDMPHGGFYQPQSDQIPFPGVLLNMILGYYVRYELEGRAGGPAAQNANHVYSLSQTDRAQLKALGMTSDEMNALLTEMNDLADIEAHRPAREYLKRYADYRGLIHAPVLMLHNIEDPITPVQGTEVYDEIVTAQSREDLLMRVYTNRTGHCNYTPQQVLAMVQAMDHWIETGNAPTRDTLPEEDGFVHDFEPGPWPQPPSD